MGELRNVIETKRKILTMIKGAKNEKRHQSHLWNLWKKLLDWGKLHNQRLQKLIRIRRKKKATSMSHKDFKKKPRIKLVGKFLCLIEIDQWIYGWFMKIHWDVWPFSLDWLSLAATTNATKESEGQDESSQALETLCERIRSETLLSSICVWRCSRFISYILIIIIL